MSNNFIIPVTAEEYEQLRTLDQEGYLLDTLSVTQVDQDQTDEELHAEMAAKFGEDAVSEMMYPARWYTKTGKEDVHRLVSEMHTLADIMEPECKPMAHTRTDMVGDRMVLTLQLSWRDTQSFTDEERQAITEQRLSNSLTGLEEFFRSLENSFSDEDEVGTGFYL